MTGCDLPQTVHYYSNRSIHPHRWTPPHRALRLMVKHEYRPPPTPSPPVPSHKEITLSTYISVPNVHLADVHGQSQIPQSLHVPLNGVRSWRAVLPDARRREV